MHPHHRQTPAFAFEAVRSISGVLIAFLCFRAAQRLLGYVIFRFAMPSGEITAEQYDTIRIVDTALLGLENLATIIAVVLVLVWLYRVTKAIRMSGGDTTLSPGMAVGGWFIPIGNVVLPWLAVRSALRGVGLSSALAGVWWLTWLAGTSLGLPHHIARQIDMAPELLGVLPPEVLDSLFNTVNATFWPYFLLDTAAFGLLAVIVAIVRKAAADR
jgi:hypothetical protein